MAITAIHGLIFKVLDVELDSLKSLGIRGEQVLSKNSLQSAIRYSRPAGMLCDGIHMRRSFITRLLALK